MSVVAPSSPPSRPQIELHLIVKQKYSDAELDYHVWTWEGKSRWIDIAVPSLMVAIEYEGWLWHSAPQRRKADAERKGELEALGWRVLEVNKRNVLLFIANMEKYLEWGLRLPPK